MWAAGRVGVGVCLRVGVRVKKGGTNKYAWYSNRL